MSEPVILTDTDNRGVATVTLNRPDKFNTWNPELLTALAGGLQALAGDDAVRLLVLRGAGKHFSAGADVNWFKELAEAAPDVRKEGAVLSVAAMRGLFEFPKPTIALIHNACFGGATGYAAGCDVVIASEDAKFAITEVRVGITPAPILPQLIAALGVRQAKRYAVSGETFDVHRAKEIGLVHEICPVGGLDEAAAPVIDGYLRSGPAAVGRTKRLIGEISGTLISDAMAEQMAEISASGRSTPEGIEGFQAFLGKRTADWYPDRDE